MAPPCNGPQQTVKHRITPSSGWPVTVTTKGKHIMKRKLLVAAICAALVLPAVPMLVHAQDATQGTKQDKKEAKKLKAVVVTGSLIPQSEIETASPVITITAADIKAQGFRNVYDALHSMPISTGSVQDSQAASQGSFTPGATTISLFGLDPGFTLILLNGHPLADYPLPYNGSQSIVDLSTIPTSMVDHIDILTGGASSLYGSSAVAGVVNIVLKRHISGLDFDYRAGGYSNGGGENQRIQVSGGHTWGNLDTSYALSLESQQAIKLYQTFDPSRLNNPYGPPYVAGRDFLQYSPFYGTYIDPGQATCAPLSGLFGGTLGYMYRPGHGHFCGSYYDESQASILNKNLFANGYFNADYRLNDNTTLYGDILYGFSKPTISGGTAFWGFQNPALAQSANPYSSVYWDNAQNQFLSLQRIFAPSEMGGANGNADTIYTRQYNVDLGLRGNFGQSDWSYDAYYNRSQVNTNDSQRWPLTQPFINYYMGAQQGSDPYGYGFPAYTPNLSHFYTPLTPQQFDAMTALIQSRSISWQQNVHATVTNTDLFQLPAGSVGFAGIIEGGDQSFDSPVDPRLIAGDFNNRTGTQGGGSRRHYAIGGELRVPVTSMLTADMSARYDRYTYAGRNDSKPTYKIGLEFRPIKTLLLRANYATAFRAPDMYYIFQGNSGFYQGGIIDYYQCRLQGYTAATIGNCNTPPGGSIFSFNKGNPALKDITAKTYGFGVVWSPTEHFDFKADYTHIAIANEVQTQDINTLLATEADCRIGTSFGGQAYDINSALCQNALAQVVRFPANDPFVLAQNQIQYVTVQPVNIASEKLDGIQSSATYRMDFGRYGNLALSGQYYIELHHTYQQGPGDPVIDLLHNFNSYEFKSRTSASASWAVGNWTSTVYGTLYGRATNYLGTGTAGRWAQFNGSVQYNIGTNSYVTLIINNIANRRPPVDASFAGGNYSPPPYYNVYVYNGYGRAFWLEFNTRFGG